MRTTATKTSANKRLMSKTIAEQVCYMLSSAKQKREITKVLRRVRNTDEDGSFFVFPFGIDRCYYIFSLSPFSEPLAY